MLKKIMFASLIFCSLSSFADNRYAWELNDNVEQYNSYIKSLTHDNISERISWLYTLNGPSSPSKTVEVDDKKYELFNICKAHDCGDNISLFIMDNEKRFKGIVQSGDDFFFFGNPNEHEINFLQDSLENRDY